MTATTRQPLTSRSAAGFPPTRYQGSKRKLAQAIVEQLQGLPYGSVLDAFGGTGAVAYAFKRAGKCVVYNDVLAFNHQIGLALIENDAVRLADDEAAKLGTARAGGAYDDFIERTFDGVYFTGEENRWLDIAVANIQAIRDRYQRAIAWFALVQAAMAKRPYNLFHRCNLYMRTADVPRGFGNKASWDRGFAEHFRRYVTQANAAVFDGGGKCHAVCGDALEAPTDCDLVYVDTPYINRAGIGVDYRDFYHFLEGLLRYSQWPDLIDHSSKHRRLARTFDPWSNASTCRDMFRRLFDRFRRSLVAVSFRSDGTPPVDELVTLLRDVKAEVRVIDLRRYQYALSTRRDSRELLIIGTD